MFDIKEALKNAPNKPGVYIMKDKVGTIIYVGKAKNLRNRLRSYFQKNVSNRKVAAMVSHIYEFEYIIVDNEVESLILEQNLIKQNMPKYNILLKDDKQYPYVKINISDRFPKITKTRYPKDDGSIYFGPFTNTFSVNESIEFFNKYYKIRTCGLNLNDPNKTFKPCLNYHINLCDGPCMGTVSEEEYNENIQSVVRFFEGKDKKVFEIIDKKMQEASKNLDFESAIYYRNLTSMLLDMLTKQSVERLSIIDKDIIAMARGAEEVCIQIFFVRGGKILGREHYILDDQLDLENKEILGEFLKQYYAGYTRLPNEIYIEVDIPDKEVVEEFLSKLKEQKVRIIVPQRGENLELIQLVKKNAKDMLSKYGNEFSRRNKENRQTLTELQELLDLRTYPERIEAYDISHIAGDQSVGAMVVFENGQMKRSDYRRFKITSAKNDDYKSLKEVLTRRFRRYVEKSGKSESFHVLPDLIMMDGGKGQVNICLGVLREMNLDIEVIGLVKDSFHQTRGIIYNNQEFNLPVETNLYRMIYKIQEEAHRFAINYHRTRMSNRLYQSELDNISGIGPKRKKAMIEHFKSIEKIKSATLEELLQVPSMSRTAAESVYNYFRGE